MFFHRKRVFVSPRSAQKKRKQIALGLNTLVLLFIILIAGAGFISWLPELTIEEIKILGNTTVPEEDVRAYLEERIKGEYLYIFSRANVFLFQPKVIERELLGTFKKIKHVNVSRDSLQSVVVDIDERKPFYVWCDSETSGEAERTCYFLDINGYAFAPAPYFSGHVYFEFYKRFERGNENPIGIHLFPETEFKRLISFRNSLRELDLNIYALKVEEAGDFSFLLTNGARILFHPKQDFDIVTNNLAATFDTQQFADKKKRNVSLEYIDARFDNKVYYRFK